MPRLDHLLTSLVFAAHALLGCGVHHICQHASGRNYAATEACVHPAAHDCHHEDSTAPDEGDSCPLQTCEHASCSFLKSDIVRIDQERHILLSVAALMDVDLSIEWTFGGARVDFSRAHLDSPPLYVWHCALVI